MGDCFTEILSSKTQDLSLGHEVARRKPVTDEVKHRNFLILFKGERSMRESRRISGFTQNFGNMSKRNLKNTTKNLIGQAKQVIASGKVKQECDLSISRVKGSPAGASEDSGDPGQSSQHERAGPRTLVERAGTLGGMMSRHKN
jgi:hypothetical protein